MEMCFKLLNGSNTTICSESMRFCLFASKKIYVWPPHLGSRESTASLSHKCSSSREVRRGSLDSVLKERTVAPLCHRTAHTPRQESKTAGFRQTAGELTCQAPDCGPSCGRSADMHACNQIDSRSRFMAAEESQERLFSCTPILLQKGAVGVFLVWQSPKHFPSRGKSSRLGY